MLKYIAFVLCLTGLLSVMGTEPLFKDGRSTWKIQIAPQAAPAEIYASEELQIYLEKISGVRLEIIRKAEISPAHTIVIGTPDSFRELEEYGNTDKNTDRLAVHTRDKNLILVGNSPRGALYAVYTFLSDVLGIRWVWAGEDGEIVPRKNSLVLPSLEINQKASFQYRGFHLCGKHYEEETERWMARHKLNIMRSNPPGRQEWRTAWNHGRIKKGFHIMFSAHNVILGKDYYSSQPELFALVDGKRLTDQLCWSNPELRRIIIERNLEICRNSPEMEILSIFPADNKNYCKCAECSKHSVSDLWFGFFEEIARAVKAEFPGKQVATIAYQGYWDPPSYNLTQAAFIEYCLYNRCYIHQFGKCQINSNASKKLSAWKNQPVPLLVYGYEFNIFTPHMHTPFYTMLADQIRQFRTLGIQGVIPEAMPKNYMPVPPRFPIPPSGLEPYEHHKLAYYIYAELLWNPDRNIEDLIREYSEAAFGAAALPMMEYFALMSKAWDGMNIHYSYFFNSPLGCAEHLLNETTIKNIDAIFRRAELAVETVSYAPERERIQKYVAREKQMFQAWSTMFRNYAASKSGLKAVVPRSPAPGDFTGAVRLELKSPAEKPAPKTEVAINWDREFLYIKAICHDSEPARLSARAAKRDADISGDDTFEVIIAVPGDPTAQYRRFAVNPVGVRLDTAALGDNVFDLDWNSDWTAETKINPADWTVSLRIPFKDLGAVPGDGDSWQFALKRSGAGRFADSGFPGVFAPGREQFGLLRFSLAKESRNLLLFAKLKDNELNEVTALLEQHGYQVTAINDERKLKNLPTRYPVILLRATASGIDPVFYQDYVLPALKNGALVILASQEALPLEKMFGQPQLALKWSGAKNHDPQRKSYELKPGDWQTVPENLAASLLKERAPSTGFQPIVPDEWDNLASMKTNDGQLFSYLLAKRIGRGLLVVSSGSFDRNTGWVLFSMLKPETIIMLLKNMYACLPATDQP